MGEKNYAVPTDFQTHINIFREKIGLFYAMNHINGHCRLFIGIDINLWAAGVKLYAF